MPQARAVYSDERMSHDDWVMVFRHYEEVHEGELLASTYSEVSFTRFYGVMVKSLSMLYSPSDRDIAHRALLQVLEERRGST